MTPFFPRPLLAQDLPRRSLLVILFPKTMFSCYFLNSFYGSSDRRHGFEPKYLSLLFLHILHRLQRDAVYFVFSRFSLLPIQEDGADFGSCHNLSANFPFPQENQVLFHKVHVGLKPVCTVFTAA
jgi:hypothetical protein